MKVSIIVPNYNHDRFLQQRIDSILNQTFQDFELILLDDASTDNSRSILNLYRNHPKVSHIEFNQINSGSPFSQWNKGIRIASGEWIWIAESDDWAEPNFLESLLAQATIHPTCGIISSRADYVDTEGKFLWAQPSDNNVHFYNGKNYILHRLLYRNSLYNVSMLIFRKEVALKCDFNSIATMKICGDWLFYTQILSQSDLVDIEQPLSHFRRHHSNISDTAEVNNHISMPESISILNYITSLYSISHRSYRKHWARLWNTYSQNGHYSIKENLNIARLFSLKHIDITLIALIRSLWHKLK